MVYSLEFSQFDYIDGYFYIHPECILYRAEFNNKND
jgi:hypothetical protein